MNTNTIVTAISAGLLLLLALKKKAFVGTTEVGPLELGPYLDPNEVPLPMNNKPYPMSEAPIQNSTGLTQAEELKLFQQYGLSCQQNQGCATYYKIPGVAVSGGQIPLQKDLPTTTPVIWY